MTVYDLGMNGLLTLEHAKIHFLTRAEVEYIFFMVDFLIFNISPEGPSPASQNLAECHNVL